MSNLLLLFQIIIISLFYTLILRFASVCHVSGLLENFGITINVLSLSLPASLSYS